MRSMAFSKQGNIYMDLKKKLSEKIPMNYISTWKKNIVDLEHKNMQYII